MNIAEDDPAEIDDVPKLTMTQRDSLVSCTIVVAVYAMVEYLPS